jgi:hypothetical protein
MWHEEHLWNVSVLQRVHLFNLVFLPSFILSSSSLLLHILDRPVARSWLQGADRYWHLLTSLPPFLPALGVASLFSFASIFQTLSIEY